MNSKGALQQLLACMQCLQRLLSPLPPRLMQLQLHLPQGMTQGLQLLAQLQLHLWGTTQLLVPPQHPRRMQLHHPRRQMRQQTVMQRRQSQNRSCRSH